MIVNVAGAGAGKTTKMADLISSFAIPDGKVVFCIAFTNAAADNIKEKVTKIYGNIPNNIRISTIHSFLYQELIKPYYYFLYGKNFEHLSNINLPSTIEYKKKKLSELEKENILHVTNIPEKAKWVVCKKSSDNKVINETRARIISGFLNYCAAIFVDEAQDIGGEERCILESLDRANVQIILYGDPKQDVKGFRCFREIIDNNGMVNYISDCHRCPQKHLNISNLFAPDSEKQSADEKHNEGHIDVVFESDIDNIHEYLHSGNFGLTYISQKNQRFDTHEIQSKNNFESLRCEVFYAMKERWGESLHEYEIRRGAFYITEQMLKKHNDGQKANDIIIDLVKRGIFNSLTKPKYAQMISAMQSNVQTLSNIPVVNSIEAVKGLEADSCLFILTSDLASYLFQNKTDDNKTKHLLYVALTRSSNNLTFLITREVESKYQRTKIISFFEQFELQ